MPAIEVRTVAEATLQRHKHDEQARLTRLQHVETKTRERLQALAHQESNKEEQQALIDAIATIRVFKEPQEIA